MVMLNTLNISVALDFPNTDLVSHRCHYASTLGYRALSSHLIPLAYSKVRSILCD